MKKKVYGSLNIAFLTMNTNTTMLNTVDNNNTVRREIKEVPTPRRQNVEPVCSDVEPVCPDAPIEIKEVLPTTPRRQNVEPVCPDAPRKNRRDDSPIKSNLFGVSVL